jgi:hypothetical protein
MNNNDGADVDTESATYESSDAYVSAHTDTDDDDIKRVENHSV